MMYTMYTGKFLKMQTIVLEIFTLLIDLRNKLCYNLVCVHVYIMGVVVCNVNQTSIHFQSMHD